VNDAFKLRSVLAVCAHPDDESFGLGAVLSTLAAQGATVFVLCFTHGEASSLGGQVVDLARVRPAELEAAARALGVAGVRLCDHPDGLLASVERLALSLEVQQFATSHAIDGLIVFDDGGITGHPDHQAATDAAIAAARQLHVPVLAWVLPVRVAVTLNEEFGAGFVGREQSEIDLELTVDRRCQLAAIACHASQSMENSVLWRRMELTGPTEALRWLIPPAEELRS
jgi:LmbE family N-acetylglucosaminyl deacetylase